MGAGPEQFVIADLLANAVEPWDGATARELEALSVRGDADKAPLAPVVIAAYRNERGAVLLDGVQRLEWLASSPRNQTVISADDVVVDVSAVDEESAHLAAVKLKVSRRPAPARVKDELAVRLQARFGWSKATIAEALQVSGPVVSGWIRQMGGADIPEITGADGRVYPARGKQAAPAAGAGSVSDAIKALHADLDQAVRHHPQARHIKIDRHGSTDPTTWTVTVPAQSASAAAGLADRLTRQAQGLLSLARKLSPVPDAEHEPDD
ncbi:MAG TPA: hypothetical protein VFQ44_15415 [Streptosporangiaceae bacterium]|nr:hypothetical protein [Streptosporangiaceae bacterium]